MCFSVCCSVWQLHVIVARDEGCAKHTKILHFILSAVAYRSSMLQSFQICITTLSVLVLGLGTRVSFYVRAESRELYMRLHSDQFCSPLLLSTAYVVSDVFAGTHSSAGSE